MQAVKTRTAKSGTASKTLLRLVDHSRDYFVASLTLSAASFAASAVLSAAFLVASLVSCVILSSFSPAVSSFLQPCPTTRAATSIGPTIQYFIMFLCLCFGCAGSLHTSGAAAQEEQ